MTSPLPTATGEITGLLRQASNGDTEALAQVTPLVYGELHRLAHSRLAREGRGHTLETGALVHETWLRMVDQRRVTWQDRGHFFAVAAEAMRRILVDHARARRAARRGGTDTTHLTMEAAGDLPDPAHAIAADDQLLALDEALDRLARISPEGARIVQYRFFAGLANHEVAQLMGTSERTVRRSWTAARAWLHRELSA